jgi:F0F1-type ATP synthase assembly protein I
LFFAVKFRETIFFGLKKGNNVYPMPKNLKLLKKLTMDKKEKQFLARRSSSEGGSALGLAFELGYTIAIPLVVFALLGRFADKKLGTSPFLLLLGILLSIAITSWLVWKKTLDIMK